jgi:hypothetical protein
MLLLRNVRVGVNDGIQHAFATAERMRAANEGRMMQVIGLIHLLGLVLAQLHAGNWPVRSVKHMRQAGPTVATSVFTFDHAEYLYLCLTKSPGVRLPAAYLLAVRFQACYDFHRGSFARLQTSVEREARELTQRLCVYSAFGQQAWQPIERLEARRLRDYYKSLVDEWLPPELVC